MAELALYIGDSRSPTGFKDGDIIHGFNNLWIQRVHAEHISKTNTELRREWCDCMCEFRYERLSASELDIVRISDGARHRIKSNVLFDNPFDDNAKPEQMDIDQYVTRRKRSGQKFIDGKPGKEIWWGGKNFHGVQSCVDTIWTLIEAKTPHNRSQNKYKLWPCGKMDLRHFLFISVNDCSVEDRGFMEGSQYRQIGNEPGNVQLIRKRNHRVNWQGELGISGRTIDQIRDRNVSIDKREQFDYRRDSIVRRKVGV